jgi:FMN-dependent NADH-azoreductase
MLTILHLCCSPRGDLAHSRVLSEAVVARLRLRHPEARVVRRDLATTPPALVDAAFSAAILAPPDFAAPALAASEVLIGELEAADALVIGTPMHKYSVPAVLKAWIDQIVRIHRTFRSTPGGKLGVLADRPVYVAVASGGWFTGPSPSGAPAQPDFLTPYLRAVFATIGLRDVHFLAMEGVTRGTDIAARARAAALARLDALLPASSTE